jgi:hypothetical protein
MPRTSARNIGRQFGRFQYPAQSKLDRQRLFRANRQQIILLEFIRSVDLGVGDPLS